MLDSLNTINWSALTTSCGPETEVPNWLRDAMGSDSDAQALAYRRLRDALYDHGDRFPASAAAIPFLIEISINAVRRVLDVHEST